MKLRLPKNSDKPHWYNPSASDSAGLLADMVRLINLFTYLLTYTLALTLTLILAGY